jgi:hypothetical protein
MNNKLFIGNIPFQCTKEEFDKYDNDVYTPAINEL